MEPHIIDKPDFKVVGLPGEFSQDTNHRIPALWKAFWQRHKEIKNPVGKHCYGMCIGMDDDRFTYLAALEVGVLNGVPESMCGYDIPARTYAVFTVPLAGKDPIGKEIGRANRFIWKTWLPESGYRFARAPDFEYYDQRFDPKTLSGEIDLYIPVVRK